MVISVTKFDIIENRNRKGLDKFQFKCWICLEKCESLFLCVWFKNEGGEGVDMRLGFVICVRDLRRWEGVDINEYSRCNTICNFLWKSQWEVPVPFNYC